MIPPESGSFVMFLLTDQYVRALSRKNSSDALWSHAVGSTRPLKEPAEGSGSAYFWSGWNLGNPFEATAFIRKLEASEAHSQIMCRCLHNGVW